ncbi:MAG: ComF family protein [Bacteroidota bacterium]
MQKVTRFLLKNFVEWKENILHLIYPNVCLVCEKELSKFESDVCSFCVENLKYTAFEKYEDESTLDKLFWGRVQLEHTFSLLYFEKGNQTQKILHQIKYKGKQELGEKMGELMAKRLLENPSKLHGIDVLIPVPLHLKKQHTRGYNQSEVISNGLSVVLNIPTKLDFLTRVKHAESQTRKSRFMRWDNIEEAFFVNENHSDLKHIAIIDDVITTGSTLESCMKMILEKYPQMKISVFSLAVTK